jgi:hypothetical protein
LTHKLEAIKEDSMNLKRSGSVLMWSVVSLFAGSPVWAQSQHCQQVGGALMTNIGVIPAGGPFGTNLGPVSGDLNGSVAATILGENADGSFNVQHYWVTASGETIKLGVAHLMPVYPVPGNNKIVSVLWGNYRSRIEGGDGKFANATGYLDYFGAADFSQLTLVLRYRGRVCYANARSEASDD